MKMNYKIILSILFALSLVAYSDTVCINGAYVMNNNTQGKWGYATRNDGSLVGYAVAKAGYQGTIDRDIHLRTTYYSNRVERVYRDFVVKKTRSASVEIKVPTCGDVTKITAIVEFVATPDSVVTLAQCDVAPF